MTKEDDWTMRERVALRILRLMFLIVAPYQDFDHKNKNAMEDLFNE
jgi:hypothetical protein